jgi:hypothetical protein
VAARITAIGVALAAMGLAAPVLAQSVDSDVRCLLAANVFARQEKDPARKQLAAAASVFYLGRLDARISNEQLKAAVLAQAKAMPAASLGPTMTDCAKHLQQKGLALNTLAASGPTPPLAAPPKRK